MAYHKYPSQLLADIPAYTTRTHNIQMPTIQKGLTFDWNNITPQYIEGNYTAEQGDAVATLMLACGCALGMDYGESSSAFPFPSVLTDYFGYDKELVRQVFRDNFTLKQWTDIIDQELEGKRPIMYMGVDRYSGHEFVCDGADGKGLYHINWGWGGNCDNFFDISILDIDNPDNPADDADGYVRECHMIIGITPDNGIVDKPLFTRTPFFIAGDMPNSITWTKSKRTNEKEEFEADMTATFSNFTDKDITGYFAVGVEKSDGNYDFLMKTTSPYTLTVLEEDKTCNFSFSYAFPIGSTKLRYLYSADGKTWEPCGSYNFVPTLITATETEIKTDASALTIDISLEDNKHLELQEPVTGTFKITNNMSEEFDGGMYLHMRSNDEDSTSCILGTLFASIPADSTVTKKATFTPTIAGDVTLYFIDGKNLVIGQCDCTVIDNTTAISAPTSSKQATCNASGGKGCVTIKASEARSVNVYNANGQKVAELHLKCGEEKTLSLQPGIYIVDKKKVLVR